jgi:choline dehydrogenase-like flavoprotein
MGGSATALIAYTEASGVDTYAHLIGGGRMTADARDGVVDADLRSFAIPNLYIIDGSVFPTQGSANPALTVMALAARAADHLAGTRTGSPVAAGRG